MPNVSLRDAAKFNNDLNHAQAACRKEDVEKASKEKRKK